MAEIDHIVLGARTLAEGAAFVEQHLGAKPRPGGAHPGVGTHNLLLGLGNLLGLGLGLLLSLLGNLGNL